MTLVDDLEIVDVPAWDPDDDLSDEDDDHSARWRLEHAGELSDIEADLDDALYASESEVPAPVRITRRAREPWTPALRGTLPAAVRDIGRTA